MTLRAPTGNVSGSPQQRRPQRNTGVQYGQPYDLAEVTPIGGNNVQVGGDYTPSQTIDYSSRVQPSNYQQAIEPYRSDSPYRLDLPVEAQWAVEDAPMIQQDVTDTIGKYGVQREDPQISDMETTATTKGQKSELMQGVETAAGIGLNALTQQAQANANMAANEYAQDVNYWKQQGKYWFDPNAELMPDLQAYMGQMPSATDALTESALLGGSTADSTTAQILINPAGVLGDQGAYVGEKAIERAIEGYAVGGGWGAVAGAAVGVIEGLWNWSDAEEADKKAKQRAMAEYDRKVQEWIARRNKQIREYNKAMNAKRRGMAKQEQVAKARAKEKVARENEATRAQLGRTVARAGAAASKRKSDFLNRWN